MFEHPKKSHHDLSTVLDEQFWLVLTYGCEHITHALNQFDTYVQLFVGLLAQNVKIFPQSRHKKIVVLAEFVGAYVR